MGYSRINRARRHPEGSRRRNGGNLAPVFLSLNLALAAILTVPVAAQAPQKPKPLKPIQLDSNVSYTRDKSSGELILRQPHTSTEPPAESPGGPPALRVQVNLVPVNCNVFAPDGTSVTGLTRDDFRLFEDNIEQRISYFDAGNDPASVALVIDASPSVLPDAGDVQAAARGIADALAPRDEVAVVEFSAHSYILSPFTRDRDEFESAIARVNVRQLFGDQGGSNIYETVYLAGQQLFRGRTGRKAILLLTDGQDNGLGLTLADEKDNGKPIALPPALTFDDVVRGLAAEGVEVYAVSTQNRPKVMTDDWLAAHSARSLLTEQTRKLGIPAYTLFLAELVRRAGGGLYFLRETRNGRDAFARIAGNIRTQYTLGFYPAGENAATPGWHQLRVVPAKEAQQRVVNRAAFYVAAQK